jgi:hypothetical protein
MKNRLILIICFAFSIISCDKETPSFTPITTENIYSIEKLSCNEQERFFNWRCSFSENYIQKNINNVKEANFRFQFSSDNFNPSGYGFRVTVFVNNILRFRRATREFPFETTLQVPVGSVVMVRTFVETLGNLGNEQSGNIMCKVSCE